MFLVIFSKCLGFFYGINRLHLEVVTQSFYGLIFFERSKFSIIFFLKKMKFWDNSHNFYYFGKKIRSRRHFPHLPKLTILFSKNKSKFRANNHFLFVLIFYSQVEKNDFWHFCYEVYRFSQLRDAKGVIFLH